MPNPTEEASKRADSRTIRPPSFAGYRVDVQPLRPLGFNEHASALTNKPPRTEQVLSAGSAALQQSFSRAEGNNQPTNRRTRLQYVPTLKTCGGARCSARQCVSVRSTRRRCVVLPPVEASTDVQGKYPASQNDSHPRRTSFRKIASTNREAGYTS